MNARVLMLFLVSALFVLAWSGDQRAMQRAYARQEAERSVLLAQRMGQRLQQLAEEFTPAALPAPAATDPQPEVLVPFPVGIAPGQYRAVSQSGTTTMVTVDDAANRQDSAAVTRDFYVVDDAVGERWYLIRVAAAE